MWEPNKREDRLGAIKLLSDVNKLNFQANAPVTIADDSNNNFFPSKPIYDLMLLKSG